MTTPPGEGGWVPLQGRSESKGGVGSLGTQWGASHLAGQGGTSSSGCQGGAGRLGGQGSTGSSGSQGCKEHWRALWRSGAGWCKSFGRTFMGLSICIKAVWDQRRLRRWRKTGQDQRSLRRAGLGICGPVWAKQANSSPLWAWFGNRSPLWAWFMKGKLLWVELGNRSPLLTLGRG